MWFSANKKQLKEDEVIKKARTLFKESGEKIDKVLAEQDILLKFMKDVKSNND